MWQTLLNRLTASATSPSALLKRDLGAAPARRAGARPRWSPLIAGPLLAPVAVLAELAAGLARPRRLDRRRGEGGGVSAARDATVIVPDAGRRAARRDAAPRSPAASTRRSSSTTARGDGVAARLRRRRRGRGRCALDATSATRGAINLGAAARRRRASLVLLNDDCVCDPGFVERITAPIDPGAGVGDGRRRDARLARPLADRQRRDGARPDPARLRLPERRAALARSAAASPTRSARPAAAAAFDRATLPLASAASTSGLFAYWEDVDLVLRLRRLGLRCALAPDALGDHEHSATLGSGSARKNYLMGFGRGYVLRKWEVLDGRRTRARCCVREGVLCAGQAVVDRNVAGVRGRLRGYRAARGRASATRRRSASSAAQRRRRRDPAPPRPAPLAAARAAPGAARARCARSPSSTSPTPAARRARSRPSSPGSPARARSTSSSPGRGSVGERCSATTPA